ncbi:unnamed protein product, partial [Didymodactylos carnosus]
SMVVPICLRLEIDDAYSADLTSLNYLTYRAPFYTLDISPINSLSSGEKVDLLTTATTTAYLKANSGQREARELVLETYVFDGSQLFPKRRQAVSATMSNALDLTYSIRHTKSKSESETTTNSDLPNNSAMITEHQSLSPPHQNSLLQSETEPKVISTTIDTPATTRPINDKKEQGKQKADRKMSTTTNDSTRFDIKTHLSSAPEQQQLNAQTIPFYCGNHLVDITKGIMHLYKENKSCATDDITCKRSEMLCMLAIPADVPCRELISFIYPVYASIEYLRIIRDPTPNQYMCLIKLKSQDYYNNRQFNSIEKGVCHLAYVAKVDITSTAKEGSCPTPGLTELPPCYICLERIVNIKFVGCLQ